MKKGPLFLLAYLYFICASNKCNGLKINRAAITPNVLFSIEAKGERKAKAKAKANPNANSGGGKNNPTSDNHKKKVSEQVGNKFLHLEQNKRVSINPLFNSLCKNVSVSEACLYNVQEFFNEANYNNGRTGNLEDKKLFCGVLYGTYEDDSMVKIENVFFALNRRKQMYDVDYLLNSEDRRKADALAKRLNWEVVGVLYAYPDIGVDLSVSNKKRKNFVKLNKKIKTLNDEENELFIPIGGREVLLALTVMKHRDDRTRESLPGEAKEMAQINNGATHNGATHNGATFNGVPTNGAAPVEAQKQRPKTSQNDTPRKKKKKKKKIPEKKKKKTKTVGMDKSSKSIVVEAYEINYDLLKLLNKDMIKDMQKQNSILHFEANKNEKDQKIKNFNTEVDLMNELYLKCKSDVLIEKIEVKQIDVLFCVNNVPILSHKSLYNTFFPYPNNSNYYTILQRFNYMSRSLHNQKDMVNIFRDFNFLLFLTNIFSFERDIPPICKAVNDLNNSVAIPDQYVSILRSLSQSANAPQ
ncbi:hypothetical protein C922_03439 [Plasmodium inui San Antonio 1]|uniref:JAB1/MPN/MOV34 metalloenzyme domain-containing protein n=1 Tax=Plasmodium inui San Antonio 1 TaxID=1237626 RepID=W7AAZ3_9APIC|nr:hypothetical protein C922_03439 [Plasmodium inui San Antonio 1]EUD66244.1 hypothetical protein C922_03439 [Plasmodium inui San Antonio 1]